MALNKIKNLISELKRRNTMPTLELIENLAKRRLLEPIPVAETLKMLVSEGKLIEINTRSEGTIFETVTTRQYENGPFIEDKPNGKSEENFFPEETLSVVNEFQESTLHFRHFVIDEIDKMKSLLLKNVEIPVVDNEVEQLKKENERLKNELSSKSEIIEKLVMSRKSKLEIPTEIKAKSKKESKKNSKSKE